MNIWRIIFANLKHSWQQHMGTCLGVSLGSMILVGALTVGDSVRATLLRISQDRIGLVTHSLLSEEGYFHSDLADRTQALLPAGDETRLAPVLMTQGTFVSPNGKIKVSRVKVLGIDDRFFHFAQEQKNIPDLNQSGFWLSPDLAKEIEVGHGTRMVLRVEEPSLFSRDAPLSGERDARFVSWNRPVLGKLSSSQLGEFSLYPSMDSIRTVFAPLSMLQQDMFISFDPVKGRTDFANQLLISTPGSLKSVLNAIEKNWTLADAGLEVLDLRSNPRRCLRTRSVFLSDSMVNLAKEIDPDAQGELTYLVNAIHKSESHEGSDSPLIPYSMVTGIDPLTSGFLDRNWTDDQIALNEWAAQDLNASLGDKVTLHYFVVAERRKLIEQSKSFSVGIILPMPPKVPPGEESDWTPRFPGLSGAENCGEWDTGIPIKHNIRVKDETYWDDYRGTPKAFVSLSSAQSMWGNRWGKLTGLRMNGLKTSRELENKLSECLLPSDSGVRLIELEANALAGSVGPVDFSQLFLAFGFFVILVGFALSSLLFGFSMDQRSRQVGMLLAVGYRIPTIRWIIGLEASAVCVVGSVLGLGWAWFFGKSILWMLGGSWSGAVSNLQIIYSPSVGSIIAGLGISFFMGLMALSLASRKLFKIAPVVLLNEANLAKNAILTKEVLWIQWIERIGWVLVGFILSLSWYFSISPGVAFFATGTSLLMAGLARYYRKQYLPNDGTSPTKILDHLECRTGRKLIVIGMLAIGAFLVIGAGAFKQRATIHPLDRQSGTGGFSHRITTAMAIYDDLLGEEAGDLFDLNQDLMRQVTLVPLRSSVGDDASCLNLNQSLSPSLYGVPLDQMNGRFNFIGGSWADLKEPIGPNIFPALVDQNTLIWSLKKKVGDRLTYLNEEGKPFYVEITAVVKGSFLQGGLYLAEQNWIKNFSGRGGYQHFWMTVDRQSEPDVLFHLKDRLYNFGLEIQSTKERLTKLIRVENTYLAIFQALGGLGVLLGTIGVFVVVFRNLYERRAELAILRAIGFSSKKLFQLAWRENGKLVTGGLSWGIGAGLLGILPSLYVGVGQFSFGFLFLFSLVLFGVSILFVSWAIRQGIHQAQFQALRNE